MNYVDYAKEWGNRLGEALSADGYEPGVRPSREAQKKALIKALPGYLLFCFCQIQRQAKSTTWEPLEGLKPAQLYVIQQHHWLPDQAFSLTHEQLQLVLHDELRELPLPGWAYLAVQSDIDHLEVQGMKLKREPQPVDGT